MSTNRRKSHTRRDALVTDALMECLNGDAEVRERDIELRYFTDAEIQAAWDKHKAEILSAWIAEHPGTRPCCWWEFDAPREYVISPLVSFGMRKQISGPPHDFLGTDVKAAILPELICGLPVHHLEGRKFESETEFLRRHNLLTDAERR